MNQSIKDTTLQKKDNSAQAASDVVGSKGKVLSDNRPLIQKKANNTGLPDNLKSGIENLSGHAMDDVKVHYNSDKPAQLNAHAYAQGTNIHIASGQEKYLPHEAWHVVQQKQGRVKPTMQMKGKVNVNDAADLEKEADIMGEKALQTKSKEDNIGSDEMQNSIMKNTTMSHISTPLQLKTEVTHNSGIQKYQDQFGNIKGQLVGKNMIAYLDPHNPLVGTESEAFERTGIYVDPSYSYKDKQDHKAAKGPTAMHLLNAHLGGLAVDENLFPQRSSMNKDHLNVAEYNAKAKLLTLKGYSKEELNGARVYYGVEVIPAATTLTPDIVKDSQFNVYGPTYVDKNNNAIGEDWETNVLGDLNKSLKDVGWSASDSKIVGRGNKKDLNSSKYDGNRNHFVENVIHEDEIGGDYSRRTHHHDSRGKWTNKGEWSPDQNDF